MSEHVTTHLLDVNVLVALAVPDHVHSAAAHWWYAELGSGHSVATCPITQTGFLRFVVRTGLHWQDGVAFLADLSEDRHSFWPADVDARTVDGARVMGHRQVTDAYLAQLSRHHDGKLTTLDRGLAQAHPDVAVLVPV